MKKYSVRNVYRQRIIVLLIIICYCRSVEPQYASTAGMFGGASLITGIFGGILFTLVMPLIVKTELWDSL
jgi:hypothetical protein